MDRFLYVLTVKRSILIIIVMPFGVVGFVFFLRVDNDGLDTRNPSGLQCCCFQVQC